MVVARARDFFDLELPEFLHGIQLRRRDVRQDHRPALADEQRAAPGEFRILGHLRERAIRHPSAVIPSDRQHLLRCPFCAGKDVAHRLGRGPCFLVQAGVLRADADRRGEFQRGENRIEDVAAEVAHRPAAKVLPVAPLERVIEIRLVGAHRRGADPQVPVQRRRHFSARRLGALREARIFVARIRLPRMHRLDFSDHAVVDQLHAGAVRLVAVDLVPHLRDHLRDLRLPAHLPHLPHRVCERLLAIHMLAHFHRRHRHGRVPVVGRRDRHRINLVAQFREHLAPVLIVRRAGEYIVHLVEAVRVHIAECDELRLRMRPRFRDVTQPLAHAADGDDLQIRVWTRTSHDCGKRKRGCGCGRAVEKSAACDHGEDFVGTRR